jgi:peptidoglycan hydrolase CwlO-like protein
VTLSDIQRPKFENKISLGSLFTLISGIVAVGIIVGTVQSDVRALAQRIDTSDKKIEAGERRDDKAAETLDALKGTAIELRADQKSMKIEIERQGRSLDRIEQLLRENKLVPR